MNPTNPMISRKTVAGMTLILAIGLALRLLAFGWNNQLPGDVNLFALTSRQLIRTGQLEYPMKIHFLPSLPYLSHTTPAFQHAPLFPILGAGVAILLRTEDTFLALKLVDLLGGIALIGVSIPFFLRAGWRTEALIAGAAISTSPLFANFSANGSPFIWSSVALLVAVLFQRFFDYNKLSHYVLAGVLSALGLELHNILVTIPITFLILFVIQRQRVTLNGVAAFIGSMLISLAPMILWNLANVGTPFVAATADYVMQKIGLRDLGIVNGEVGLISEPLTWAAAQTYLYILKGNIHEFLRYFQLEVGPFTLILAFVGLRRLLSIDKPLVTQIAISVILTVSLIFAGLAFRFRYIVTFLPLVYLIASFGFTYLIHEGRSRHAVWRVIGWTCLAGMLIWNIPGYFETPPSRYNPKDQEARLAQDYLDMKSLALELKTLEPGLVLGKAQALDGGIETAYWDDLPFVAARGSSPEVFVKLQKDFEARYIWADDKTFSEVEKLFPNARLVLREGRFYVYDLK